MRGSKLTEDRILEFLLEVKKEIEDSKGDLMITPLINRLRIPSIIPPIMKKHGILGGESRFYTWLSIHPNKMMAKKLLAEYLRETRSYRIKQKDRQQSVEKEQTEQTEEPKEVVEVKGIIGSQGENLLEQIIKAFPDYSLNQLKEALA